MHAGTCHARTHTHARTHAHTHTHAPESKLLEQFAVFSGKWGGVCPYKCSFSPRTLCRQRQLPAAMSVYTAFRLLKRKKMSQSTTTNVWPPRGQTTCYYFALHACRMFSMSSPFTRQTRLGGWALSGDGGRGKGGYIWPSHIWAQRGTITGYSAPCALFNLVTETHRVCCLRYAQSTSMAMELCLWIRTQTMKIKPVRSL